MARCRCCNGRLLCMCLLPCMMTGHLLIYVLVSVFVTISYTPPPLPSLRFVAPGASANTSAWASVPLGAFWNLRLEDGALWNRLQHVWDRRHNPVLRGGNATLRAPAEEEEEEEEEDCHVDTAGLPEQMRAFVLSMHRRRYRLLINQPDACSSNASANATGGGGPLLLLMAVKSQVGNFENRQAIRETWGRRGPVGGEGDEVRTVFLLGRQDAGTGPHPDLARLLDAERRQHADILQWDFRDTFFNLTLKDLLFWGWLRRHCPAARFVFKGDDDVFVRTAALLGYLRRRRQEHGSDPAPLDLFVGDVIYRARPVRAPDAKYYVPESFYRGEYPPYAGGGGVVYSASLARRLEAAAARLRMFPIDDVFSGMCLRRLGLAPSHHPGFMTFDLPEELRGKPCGYKSVLLVHRRTPDQMLSLWKQLQAVPEHC